MIAGLGLTIKTLLPFTPPFHRFLTNQLSEFFLYHFSQDSCVYYAVSEILFCII